MTDITIIMTTTATVSDAEAVAKTLVDEKLAACVIFQPGTQSYCVWDGKAQLSAEVTVLIKTTTAKVAAIETRFKTLHPYETPVLIALPISHVGTAYGAWVREMVA